MKILLIELNATPRSSENRIERTFDVCSADVVRVPSVGEVFSPMLPHGNRLVFECVRIEAGPETLNKVDHHEAVVFGKHLLADRIGE